MTLWIGIAALAVCLLLVGGLIYALSELIPSILDEDEDR